MSYRVLFYISKKLIEEFKKLNSNFKIGWNMLNLFKKFMLISFGMINKLNSVYSMVEKTINYYGNK